MANYYLLKDNEGYKILKDGEIILVSEIPSKDVYINLGMTEIPVTEIPDFMKVFCFAEEGTLNSSSVVFKPKSKTVTPSGDIDITGKTLKALSVEGGGSVKILFSFDKGVTWRNITSTSQLSDISTAGNTIAELNACTTWSNLAKGKDNIRFAYYLTDEVANTDKITMTINFVGKWVSISDRNYGVYYPTKSSLKVELLSSGDYKINYSDELPN